MMAFLIVVKCAHEKKKRRSPDLDRDTRKGLAFQASAIPGYATTA